MAGVENYKKIIQSLLLKYSKYGRPREGVEKQVIFDAENHHYQLIRVGWDQGKYIYSVIFHLDIKEGKIWIWQDNTDIGIADELAEMGVPKTDIILAFYAPYQRGYTDFAVN